MKFEITITKIGTKFLETDETIANISVCNGNWRYNDIHMETEEKVSVTINTINQAHFLLYPVKDAYPIHNTEEALEGNLIVEKAIVRPYDNLLTYLNCRINNAKEEYRKYGWTERTYNIIMLEGTQNRKDIVADIVYDKKRLVEVKIEVIE